LPALLRFYFSFPSHTRVLDYGVDCVMDERIKKAFWEAEAFLIASQYIINHDDQQIGTQSIWRFVSVQTVAEVNHVFAVEMYLKCLCLIDGTYNGKKIHHLGKIFRWLTPPTQKRLSEIYVSKYQETDTDIFDTNKYSILEKLNATGDYFKDARYEFEKTRDGLSERNLTDVLINAIQDLIFEVKPELKSISFFNPHTGLREA